MVDVARQARVPVGDWDGVEHDRQVVEGCSSGSPLASGARLTKLSVGAVPESRVPKFSDA